MEEDNEKALNWANMLEIMLKDSMWCDKEG